YKIDIFIAQNIRIRRTARIVLFKEQFKDVIPIFCGKINGMQFNAKHVAHALRVRQIGCRGTVLLPIVLLPVIHDQDIYKI
ncbi:hypothetical protein AIZ12_25555, partial [Salmonella enterica subsp. enterica serovar Typhimurium]